MAADSHDRGEYRGCTGERSTGLGSKEESTAEPARASRGAGTRFCPLLRVPLLGRGRREPRRAPWRSVAPRPASWKAVSQAVTRGGFPRPATGLEGEQVDGTSRLCSRVTLASLLYPTEVEEYIKGYKAKMHSLPSSMMQVALCHCAMCKHSRGSLHHAATSKQRCSSLIAARSFC